MTSERDLAYGNGKFQFNDNTGYLGIPRYFIIIPYYLAFPDTAQHYCQIKVTTNTILKGFCGLAIPDNLLNYMLIILFQP